MALLVAILSILALGSDLAESERTFIPKAQNISMWGSSDITLLCSTYGNVSNLSYTMTSSNQSLFYQYLNQRKIVLSVNEVNETFRLVTCSIESSPELHDLQIKLTALAQHSSEKVPEASDCNYTLQYRFDDVRGTGCSEGTTGEMNVATAAVAATTTATATTTGSAVMLWTTSTYVLGLTIASAFCLLDWVT